MEIEEKKEDVKPEKKAKKRAKDEPSGFSGLSLD